MGYTLRELTEQYLLVLEAGLDPDFDSDSYNEMLNSITDDLHKKADGYANVLATMGNVSEGYDKEIKRLQARKKAVDNSIKRIKDNLQQAMVVSGETKFKTDLFSFNIQKNAPALKIAEGLDMKKVPVRFRVYSEPTIDKTAVKEEIKAGKAFKWAWLEQSESLRIR